MQGRLDSTWCDPYAGFDTVLVHGFTRHISTLFPVLYDNDTNCRYNSKNNNDDDNNGRAVRREREKAR